MKAMMRRSFRSAALVAAALLVGLAAVQLFAGADALDAAKASLLGESNGGASGASAAVTAEHQGGYCLLSLMTDPEVSATLTANLRKYASQSCSEGGAKPHAALQAKLGAAAEPSTCSAGAKAAKAAGSGPGTCAAAKTDAVAKTEAADAKIAKVVGDVPACCADKAGDAKTVAKVETAKPATCPADAEVAKVSEAASSHCSAETNGAVEAAAAAEIPACCQDKAAKTAEAGD
jgi:hypothetical protein